MRENRFDHIDEINLAEILKEAKPHTVQDIPAGGGAPFTEHLIYVVTFKLIQRALIMYNESRALRNLPNVSGNIVNMFSVVGRNKTDKVLYVVGESLANYVPHPQTHIAIHLPGESYFRNTEAGTKYLTDRLGLPMKEISYYEPLILPSARKARQKRSEKPNI